jgi:cytochrome c oxidase subunit 1
MGAKTHNHRHASCGQPDAECTWPRRIRVVEVDDPWGYGNSLEWATSCPQPRHNFTELPRIRSERPAFELHYPHMIERMRLEAHVGRHGHEEAVSGGGATGHSAGDSSGHA